MEEEGEGWEGEMPEMGRTVGERRGWEDRKTGEVMRVIRTEEV